MAGNHDRDRSNTTMSHYTGRATAFTNASRQHGSRGVQRAYYALRHHAQMFKALDLEIVREDPEKIVLAGDRLSFRLEYEVDRKILARIYHLRAKAEVASHTRRAAPRYQLDLKTRGVVDVSYDMVATGSGIEEGQRIADRLSASGIVGELVQKIDLEVLSIVWIPQKSAWEVTLGPYPGSHVQMIFPPLAYTVQLKETEVRDVYESLAALSEALRGAAVSGPMH